MCRRASLLWDINSKSVDEISSFLRRSYRIYFLLLLNALYNAGYHYYQQKLYNGIYDTITVILFLLFIFILRSITMKDGKAKEVTIEDLPFIHYAIGTVALIALLYLMNIIYELVGSLQLIVLINILSVLIQISTIFILIKYKEKVRELENLIQDEVEEGIS
jgi:uncharacterized protein YacL